VLPDQVIEFGPARTGEVVAWMRRLEAAHHGWINLQPGVPDKVLEHAPTPLSLFHRRPRELTLATWAAGGVRRRGPTAPTVGIQHGRPDRVRTILAKTDSGVPAGWKVISDRPANGFVARLPVGADPAEVLGWLLRAVEVVSPVPVIGTWRALVHRGRRNTEDP
jgi:hypothetical protein